LKSAYAVANHMTEAPISQLKRAVESHHGGLATFVQSVPVRETNGENTVWNGVVSVFDLVSHPTAERAYAWSYDRPNGKRRFLAMLHAPPIDSPAAAVRAATVAEQMATK
jgi:hypothetical protein